MVSAAQSASVSDHLIAILENRGVLASEQAARLRQEEHISQDSLEDALTTNYGVGQEDILLGMAEHAQIPVTRLSGLDVREELLSFCPQDMLTRRRAVPIARTKSTLTLALADPLDIIAVEEVADFSRLKVIPVAALASEMSEAVAAATRATEQGLDDILKETSDADLELATDSSVESNVDLESMLESAGDAPVIRIVNMILIEAIRKGASDIHIEPCERHLRLRYRTDGVLLEQPGPPKSLQSAVISRLKIMSEMDIAERRIPQDSRFRIKAQGREIDLRVSSLPTVHGEKFCLRLLDKKNLVTSLDSLGLDPDSLKKLRNATSQPNGLVLVTGPTGSGKTTTLYSALLELNKPEVNITTVENPVEYQVEGLNQVEIKPNVGMTFAAALRSILRQDPDIVLVGETRDAETAHIGVEAALTGHLVLTTLHTNDAPGAIGRLANMGLENFLLASSLRLSQAQRLVRRVCGNCREPWKLTEEYCEANSIPYDIFEGAELVKGRGCARCGGTGYKGRASIMEVLPITPELRELILKTTNADDIRRAAYEQGFRDLRTNGFFRVKEGVTTIEEVLRVTMGD